MHGVVVHEAAAFAGQAVDVGRFPDHQALVIRTDIHDADVVTHDEQNVGFLTLSGCHAGGGDDGKDRQKSHNRFHNVSRGEVKSDRLLQHPSPQNA